MDLLWLQREIQTCDFLRVRERFELCKAIPMVSFSMNMERIECVGFSVTCTLHGKQAAVESSQFHWIGFQVVRAKSSMLVIVSVHCWNYMNQLNRRLARSRMILLIQLHLSKCYLAGLSI